MANKLTIEIEDIGDQRQCIAAVRRLFTAFVDQYGYEEAMGLMIKNGDLNVDRARAYFRTEKEFDKALESLTPTERLLVLEYFDGGAEQSKRGLGKAFAAKYNANATSVTTQLRRAFREHPEACRIIGEAPLSLRQRKMILSMWGRRPRGLGLRRRVTKPRA
jgi:hypothetical protein